MTTPKITVRDNGPFLVEGACQVVDAAGNVYPLDPAKPAFALCRCGASKNRPFCDGSHKAAGFESSERAPS